MMIMPTSPMILTDAEWRTVQQALTVIRDRTWLTTEQRDQAGDLLRKIETAGDSVVVIPVVLN